MVLKNERRNKRLILPKKAYQNYHHSSQKPVLRNNFLTMTVAKISPTLSVMTITPTKLLKKMNLLIWKRARIESLNQKRFIMNIL